MPRAWPEAVRLGWGGGLTKNNRQEIMQSKMSHEVMRVRVKLIFLETVKPLEVL
jgi:hypothetical protein